MYKYFFFLKKKSLTCIRQGLCNQKDTKNYSLQKQSPAASKACCWKPSKTTLGLGDPCISAPCQSNKVEPEIYRVHLFFKKTKLSIGKFEKHWKSIKEKVEIRTLLLRNRSCHCIICIRVLDFLSTSLGCHDTSMVFCNLDGGIHFYPKQIWLNSINHEILCNCYKILFSGFF